MILCSHLTGFYHFVILFIAQDFLIAFYLNYPCIKWNKCQKTSLCIAFELILAFSLYSCRAGFYFLSSQYTFFFMFFIFCSFSSSWKQQKEKGEILIMIKYRPISCLVFVNNCKLYTTVNLCYFQEWIMIVELRARASSIVKFPGASLTWWLLDYSRDLLSVGYPGIMILS